MAFRPKLSNRKSVVTSPRSVMKIGRNDLCPCGSGKKYKDCHQQAGDAFLRKMARRQSQEERKATRKRMKQEGVPFWKRWTNRT